MLSKKESILNACDKGESCYSLELKEQARLIAWPTENHTNKPMVSCLGSDEDPKKIADSITNYYADSATGAVQIEPIKYKITRPSRPEHQFLLSKESETRDLLKVILLTVGITSISAAIILSLPSLKAWYSQKS
jgi:hypothetical protein